MISKLETILFVASKPISIKKISKVLKIDTKEALDLMGELQAKYNHSSSGIIILQNSDQYQMTSSPDNRESAESFLKSEVSGELTRPQLETLTVVSYCGPITKPELEQIRGVNCSLILRNLMLRGLVKEVSTAGLLSAYQVTMNYLRHLGIKDISELPNYDKLKNHPYLEQVREINNHEDK